MEKDEEGGRKGTEAKTEKEYDGFLRDLEEDPELRSGVIMYKVPGQTKAPQAAQPDGNAAMADDDEDEVDPDFPDVTLDELVDDVADMGIEDDGDVELDD